LIWPAYHVCKGFSLEHFFKKHALNRSRFLKSCVPNFSLTMYPFSISTDEYVPRAGLTIGQTGKMPGASRFWWSRAWISKHSLLDFQVFRLL